MDFFRTFIGIPRYHRPPQWPSDGHYEDDVNAMDPEKFMSSFLDDHLNQILQQFVGIDGSPNFPLQEHPDSNQTLRDQYLKFDSAETPSQNTKIDSDVDGNFNVGDLDAVDKNIWPEVKQPTFHRRSVFTRTIINADGRKETRTVVEDNKNGQKEVQITETSENLPISSETYTHHENSALRKSLLQRFADFFI